MKKYTKIGATVGPACSDLETLVAMIKAGMNFARLNFAHGTYETHTEFIQKIRAAEKITGEPVAILQDLQGPRIRVGDVVKEGITLATGQEVHFSTGVAGKNVIPIDHPELHKYVKSGERMLIDDGRIEVIVKELGTSTITGTIVQGGLLLSHKGINLPDSQVGIAALSDKDKEDLRFGVKAGVDMVGLSFVSDASDIFDVRFLVEQIAREEKITLPQPIHIIAKIERHEAIENLEAIIDAADGIMVARGDLGLELPAHEVPLIQKRLIDETRKAAKPVIVATQLLDSMRESRRPTRAEVSDVANAVIDHADALLLTNETAAGKYPVLTVETMADVITSTEKSPYDDTVTPTVRKKGASVEIAISELSRLLAEEVNAKIILAASLTGETGRLISQVRPTLPILVATEDQIVCRQLNVSWGVKPFILPQCRSIEELVERSLSYINTEKLAKKGDKMIIVAGEPVGQAGNVNLVEVREIK